MFSISGTLLFATFGNLTTFHLKHRATLGTKNYFSNQNKSQIIFTLMA